MSIRAKGAEDEEDEKKQEKTNKKFAHVLVNLFLFLYLYRICTMCTFPIIASSGRFLSFFFRRRRPYWTSISH